MARRTHFCVNLNAQAYPFLRQGAFAVADDANPFLRQPERGGVPVSAVQPILRCRQVVPVSAEISRAERTYFCGRGVPPQHEKANPFLRSCPQKRVRLPCCRASQAVGE